MIQIGLDTVLINDKNGCDRNAIASRLRSLARAGQVCHGNGTLSQLDFSPLGLVCQFPFGGLSTFTSLNTLSIGRIASPYYQVGASRPRPRRHNSRQVRDPVSWSLQPYKYSLKMRLGRTIMIFLQAPLHASMTRHSEPAHVPSELQRCKLHPHRRAAAISEHSAGSGARGRTSPLHSPIPP